jgi:hypothetical protein
MTEGTVQDALYPAARYPVVYRVVMWLRVFAVVLTLVLAGGANVLLFKPVWQGLNVPISPLLLGIDVLFTLLMLYFVGWSFTAKVTLRADAIEEATPFATRVLRVSDIKGWSRLPKGGGVLLAPKSGVPLTISKDSYNPDRYFEEWLAKLPDLKRVEEREEEARVRNDSSLGATPEQRLAANARRKSRFGKAYLCLLFGSMMVFYLGLLMDSVFKPAVFIAAAVPWCCVAVAYSYRDQWSRSVRGNNAAAMIIPMLMPTLMLLVMAGSRANLVHTADVYEPGALVGLPLLLAMAAVMANIATSASQKLLGLLVLAALAWAYGGSLLALGNRILDTSTPQVFRTHVVGWYATRGRGGPHYYLELAGWGPEPGGTNLQVGYGAYHAAHKGDPACMGAYPGRFGFPWTHSLPCPTDGLP